MLSQIIKLAHRTKRVNRISECSVWRAVQQPKYSKFIRRLIIDSNTMINKLNKQILLMLLIFNVNSVINNRNRSIILRHDVSNGVNERVRCVQSINSKYHKFQFYR